MLSFAVILCFMKNTSSNFHSIMKTYVTLEDNVAILMERLHQNLLLSLDSYMSHISVRQANGKEYYQA